MKQIKVVTARREEGVDTDALQKRLQSAFNRYRATVVVTDTRAGINVRVSTVPNTKLTLMEAKEMYAKVDHVIDGTYADIFEARASWLETNPQKGLDLVIDYVFEGEG